MTLRCCGTALRQRATVARFLLSAFLLLVAWLLVALLLAACLLAWQGLAARPAMVILRVASRRSMPVGRHTLGDSAWKMAYPYPFMISETTTRERKRERTVTKSLLAFFSDSHNRLSVVLIGAPQ